MKNVWIICRKELKSYFASPIAYLLMVLFALVFGFGFLYRHPRLRALRFHGANAGP